MSQRVLLASMMAGGGHQALRDSFHRVLAEHDPKGERFEALSWDSTHRFAERFYSACVHYIPRIQGTIYAISDSRLGLEIAARFSPQLLGEAEEALRTQRPDVVVSTHAILSMMFTKAKHALGLRTPIVSAIPDYGIPSALFNPPDASVRPDALIVMSDETEAHYLRSAGMTPKQLHLSGFLTRPAFAELGAPLRASADRRTDRLRTLKALEIEHPALRGFDPSRPTLLFMGGSAWTEKTRPVLEALLAIPEFASRVNVIVVCGRDEKFQRELTAVTKPWKNVAVFGFVSGPLLAQLMAIADVPVLGSLAPASMQELLEIGCGPLMLFHYILGTEEPHTRYIHDAQIGRYEPDPSKMLDLLMQLTGFAPARPEVEALLRGFPAQAKRIRTMSRSRARELPSFLEQLIQPSAVAATPAARTRSQESLPALRSTHQA